MPFERTLDHTNEFENGKVSSHNTLSSLVSLSATSGKTSSLYFCKLKYTELLARKSAE